VREEEEEEGEDANVKIHAPPFKNRNLLHLANKQNVQVANLGHITCITIKEGSPLKKLYQ
jgi:hypothetical protein